MICYPCCKTWSPELAKYPQNPEFRDGQPRVRTRVCARARDGGVLLLQVRAWLLLKPSCLAEILDNFCLFDFCRLD